MVFELFDQEASRVTNRIKSLVESGFYNKTTSGQIIFHRVIDNFVIQAGDPTGTGSGGSSLADFDDQFDVDLQHNRTGVLSYAKSSDDTNDSQFFITEGPQTQSRLQPFDLRAVSGRRCRARGDLAYASELRKQQAYHSGCY